jgi:hypothetical protein
MNLNKKVFNYRVLDILEIFNFSFGRFSIWSYSKILNFKFEKFKRNFP